MEKSKTAIKNKKYIYSRGGRKTAVAQCRLQKGKGKFLVNGLDYKEYFRTEHLQGIFLDPLRITNHLKDIELSLKAHSGGIGGQAEACRHAISRGLEILDGSLRPILKAEGFLKRDPRVKERKKPGLKRARRAPQWSKR